MGKKADLRRMLMERRSAITPGMRSRWNASLCAKVIAWCDMNPVQALGIYWPIRGEPDLRPAYAELSRRDIQLGLPVVTGTDIPLKFSLWKPGDDLIQDRFGVAIPAVYREVEPEAILVPCVGFTELRYRLGYGGGFYDRTLALLPRPLAIGIAYACTRTEFDAGPHDIALDLLITDDPSVPAD